MRARLLFVCLICCLLPSAATAQCTDWYSGPFVDGGADNGVIGIVAAALAWDHDGEPLTAPWLVIGGPFSNVQGVAANGIAMRDPATGIWQPLGSGISGGNVNCLTSYNGELIAAGQFSSAGGVAVNNIARWNGSVWQTLSNGINPDGTDGRILAMTVYNGKLIVAGDFTTAGGPVSFHENIASWNPTTYWEGLGVGVGCNTGNCSETARINCLAQYNGELLVGGAFGYAGNQPIPNLARWNGTTWLAPAGGHSNFEITALQVYYGEVVVGGDFTQIVYEGGGHFDAEHIARWNGSSWGTLGGGLDSKPHSLSVYQGQLVAGGSFTTAAGATVNRIARWNGATWSALDGGVMESPGYGYVSAMAVLGSELIAGGYFSFAGSQQANDIARWNGAKWAPFGGGSADIVYATTNFAGRQIAGGSFVQPAGAVSAINIAGWDGNTLHAYGSGMNASVVALESFKYPGVFGDYELIAGGLFSQAGGLTVNYVARWVQDPINAFPPPAWAPMGAGFNSGVYALERHSGATYAGGAFTFSLLTGVSRIARWNETNDVWEPLGTGMNGAVRALKSYGGFLYAGGDFTTAGGVTTGGLARWNGSSWSAVGGNFLGQVYALEVHDGRLVIAGSFPGINASPNLANYDGVSYSTYSTGGANGLVRALYSNGTELYIGGDFTTAGGVAASRVAYWNGVSWSPAEGGVNDTVLSLSGYQGEVHAGGLFTTVDGGSTSSPRWARFSGNGLPWFTQQPFSTSVAVGDDAAFTAQAAAGYGTLNYQWYHYGVPLVNGPTGYGSTIAGANAPTLQILDAVAADWGHYWAEVSNSCGIKTSNDVTLTLTGATAAGSAPGTTVFEAVGPNPFQGATQLHFSLARAGRVNFRLYDLAGRLVREIDLGSVQPGRHHAIWDARDHRGVGVASGVYMVRFEVDGRPVDRRRVTVLR